MLSCITDKSFFLHHTSFANILAQLFSYIPSSTKIPENVFEILFIQRASNKSNQHSGQLAFPGGKCDGEETDLEAVVREVLEEVGLDVVAPQNFIKYLGRSGKNFPHSPLMKCSLAVFFDFKGNQVKVNPSEIQDHKWVLTCL